MFCDMDGVLVDFEGGTEKILGRPWDSYKGKERDERNRLCFEREGFWENLEPMPGWEKLWAHIEPYNPPILTAIPRGEGGGPASPRAAQLAQEGKFEWCQKYLGIPKERFFCVMASQKQLFATSVYDKLVVNNTLLDDTHQNIVEWQRNRGHGVLHTDVDDSIKKLKLLGYV